MAHLLERDAGTLVELRFLNDLATGAYEAMLVEPADWLRIAELTSSYRDLPLGTVDASVVALAERLKISKIATSDRRHFSVVRPAHVGSFGLLP